MKILAILIMFVILSANAVAGNLDQLSISTIHVEASGNVPGFTQPELAKYLATQMQKSNSTVWRFVPGGTVSSPNRVMWKFKILNVVWKGSTHNGFPSPSYSISYLKAEAKLYLDDKYQMTIDTHPSALDADDDQSIANMARQVALTFMTDSKP